MAILNTLPGLEVSVCIDGRPLTEYEDDEDEEVNAGQIGEWQAARTIRKYVTSESDKQFSILIKVDRTYNLDSPGLEFPIRIDGKWMSTPCLTKNTHRRIGNTLNQEFVDDIRGATSRAGSGDASFLNRFKFSKIETTTEDGKLPDVTKDSKMIQEVGEIKVRVFRISDCLPWIPGDITTPKGQSSAKVHEKALKGQAKSHSTSLGPTKATSTNWVQADLLDGIDYPIAIFRFKYRSEEALRQLHVIQRTPSPEPERASASRSVLNIGNLDAEQKVKLEGFLDGLVGNNGSGLSKRPIKREPENSTRSGVARKKRKFGEKIMIDLTADSDEKAVITLD